MKNPWSNRLKFIKEYVADNQTVIDFGCGNREILEYIHPKKYLGIDQVETADLVADLNQHIDIPDHYDIALILGVLEYLDNPDQTLLNIHECADKFIILTLPVKKKHNWQRTYADEDLDLVLTKYFKDVAHIQHGRYVISICNN